MNLRDRVRDLLDTLDGIGVDPNSLRSSQCLDDVVLWSCPDYEAACAAFKAKPEAGHSMASGARRRETLHGDLLLTHICWPHLDCWRSV